MNAGMIAYLVCGILIGLFVILAIIFSIRFRDVEMGCWGSLIMILTILVVLGGLFVIVWVLPWNTVNPIDAVSNVLITGLVLWAAYKFISLDVMLFKRKL
ncbi:hypothetical protein LMB49_10655 [Limosilactobacillus reuteri]|uniref:hypothetical protein n=1 Tax=Limosilactobacillus reuteri TaxID=1598 RepID=UPI001E31D6F0|nr:hypothetical protein [Limosilactobacillus reuteri]MCC4370579.1 hypothetical protein [Limosilactobacillus reuteri]MCC4371852.1 hypothetical protein [Limosilactobacillus reuteri]MCC4509324.1 hypothetical protein [Limosilactobacillus reuteri]MCC4509367.1 hypothetical protein [Limosilactobacillus reuteri]